MGIHQIEYIRFEVLLFKSCLLITTPYLKCPCSKTAEKTAGAIKPMAHRRSSAASHSILTLFGLSILCPGIGPFGQRALAKPILHCEESQEKRSSLIVTVATEDQTGDAYAKVELYRDDTRALSPVLGDTHVFREIDEFGNRAFSAKGAGFYLVVYSKSKARSPNAHLRWLRAPRNIELDLFCSVLVNT
jgi:hypothetical protein